MAQKKSDPNGLEKKLAKLTEQLEQERTQRIVLENRLKEQHPLFSFELVSGKIHEILKRFNIKLSAEASSKAVARATASPTTTVKARSVLEESVQDDLGTYKKKLKSYQTSQLEDIFLNIDRESYPERFAAVVEELKSRL